MPNHFQLDFISLSEGEISNKPSYESDEFNKGVKSSPFYNSGLFIGGKLDY